MKEDIFRPVEFWKTAVMSMPDNSFFELLRSVFGKIKTPFKKQQLVNDLEKFLLRDDIQRTIASYINYDDIKIITAVSLLEEPASGELETFFSEELNYVQLQDIIVNLEERFILYRFREDNRQRLALNPVLKQILLPVTTDYSSLFPDETKDNETAGSAPPLAILNDRILAGLLSFVYQEEIFFKAQGELRKKIIDEGKICFPGMDLQPVLGSLQILGLFYEAQEKLIPDKNCFDEFGLLSARERSEYCAAALIVYGELPMQTEILPPLYKNRIHELTDFIHCFCDSVQGLNYSCSEKSLAKMAEILKAKTKTVFNSAALLDAMNKTGLLPPAENQKLPARPERLIAVDSGFSVLVYPEIEYADAISLASVLKIKDTDDAAGRTIIRFELDKDSAVRAFNKKITAQEIITLLNRLSGGRVDETLIWNLTDWEKRHKEVSLKKGVVLCLSEDRRYLIETMPLSSLIAETLAPGVYLMPENAIEEVSAALNSAGIDIISRQTPEKTAGTFKAKHFPPPCASAVQLNIPITGKPASGAFKTENDSSALIESLHATLEKLPLDEASRTELAARINRRLVLCEAQLKEAVVRYEKLEARHLDFAGKQNIAKQAVAQQAHVEIEMHGKKIFGVPKALDKEDGKPVMIIVPDGEREELRIPLAKMSLLRRIKKSIFT